MGGYCVVQLFTLPPSVGITLLLVVSSPGGSYSNWWCSLLNADLALSVTMTTVSTLLSIGFLPANLILWTRAAYQDTTTATGEAVLGSLDFMGIFVSILLVIAAIGVGLLGTALFARSPAAAAATATSAATSAAVGDNNTNNRSSNTTTTTTTRSHQFHKYTNLAGNVSGILLIMFSTVLSFATGDGETSDLAGGTAQFYPAIGLPILVGLLGATVLASCVSSLSKPERLTTAVECCYQNTAIAQTAAISLFSGEDLKDASRVTLLYGIFEIGLIATYLVVFWKLGWSKAPADENFCTVIAKSYEISHDEDDHTNDNDNDEENVEQQQQQQQDEEMMMVAEEVKNNRAEVVNNDWDTEEKGGDGGTTANDDDDDDDINDNDRDGEEEKEEEEEDTIIKVSDFRDENTGSSNTRISNDGDASGGDSGDGVGIINTSQYQ